MSTGRVLADAVAADGVRVCATRDALLLGPPPAPEGTPPGEWLVLAWEQVRSAAWDAETATLRVVREAAFGEPRPEHVHSFADSDRALRRLLQVIDERVRASIVLQRHVAVTERRGFTVLARRTPARPTAVTWWVEYDPTVDPADPHVRARVEAELARAADDVGQPR